MRNLTLLVSLISVTPALAAERPVCVSVKVQGEGEDAAETQTDATVPIGQDPIAYLKRLLEYYVTHEKGFVAVAEGCQDHLDVELYPLQRGWTVFARYSANGREERVDYLFPDELSQFAERAVVALLYDRPISTTIQRDTVLRADSKRATQRIRGTNHFVLGLGSELRLGNSVPTDDGSTTRDQVRVFFPIDLRLGYRGKFEAWGVETMGGLSIGTSKSGLSSTGGHLDYGGSVSLAVHFLRYLNPRGLSSWFLGAGGSFEVLWFYQVNSGGGSRANLVSGGFDLDLIGGIEFMRASKVQFFLEATVLIPAYLIDNGDGVLPVKTWFPGVGLTLGMLF